MVGRVQGGPGNDSLTGAGLLVNGGPGNDELYVNDETKAGAVLDGESGNDSLSGGYGRDVLRGGSGNDDLSGFKGAGDVYDLGSGRDKIAAGRGPDTILARDGEYDDLSCSGGRDTVVLDALDFYDRAGTSRCERVRRLGSATVWLDGGVAYLQKSFEFDAGPNELVVGFTCPHDGPRVCAGTLTVSDRRGPVVKERFRTRKLGRKTKGFRMSRRTLRRLDNWARVTLVSSDRRGKRHRRSIAGRGAVDKYVDLDEGRPHDGD